MIVRGRYISFSGIDACGKSTQSQLLATELRKLGKDVVLTREPGSHLNGFNVRSLLLGHIKVTPLALEMLFQADRAEHTQKVKALLEDGKWVISDRCYLCGFSYGLACGHDAETLRQLIELAVQVKPDMAFYLDIDSATERMARRGEALTREEAKGEVFAQKVRQNYLDLPKILPAHLKPESWMVIDGTGRIEDIHAGIVKALHVVGLMGMNARSPYGV